jgi:hypothetical protein
VTLLSWVLVGFLVVIPLALLFSRRARRNLALFMIVWLASLLALVAVAEPDVVDCLRHGSFSC